MKVRELLDLVKRLSPVRVEFDSSSTDLKIEVRVEWEDKQFDKTVED